MTDNKNLEEAALWFEAAQDDLDSGAILMMYKKHNHACLFARLAVMKALKALWFFHDTDPAKRRIPGLVRGLQKIDNNIFLKLTTYIDDLTMIDRWDSFGSPRVKESDKKESDFFVNTAYKIITEVKTIIFASGSSPF